MGMFQNAGSLPGNGRGPAPPMKKFSLNPYAGPMGLYGESSSVNRQGSLAGEGSASGVSAQDSTSKKLKFIDQVLAEKGETEHDLMNRIATIHRDTEMRVARGGSDSGDDPDRFREPGSNGIGRGSPHKAGGLSSILGSVNSHPPHRVRQQSDPGGKSQTSRLNPNRPPPHAALADQPSFPGSLGDPSNGSSYHRPTGRQSGVRSSLPATLPGLFPQSSAPAIPLKPGQQAAPPATPKIPTMGGWFTSKGKMVGPGGIEAPKRTATLDQASSAALTDQPSFPSQPLGSLGGLHGGRAGVVSEGPLSFGRSGDRNSNPGRLQMLVRERFQEVFDRMMSQKLGGGPDAGPEGRSEHDEHEIEVDPDELKGDLEI